MGEIPPAPEIPSRRSPPASPPPSPSGDNPLQIRTTHRSILFPTLVAAAMPVAVGARAGTVDVTRAALFATADTEFPEESGGAEGFGATDGFLSDGDRNVLGISSIGGVDDVDSPFFGLGPFAQSFHDATFIQSPSRSGFSLEGTIRSTGSIPSSVDTPGLASVSRVTAGANLEFFFETDGPILLDFTATGNSDPSSSTRFSLSNVGTGLVFDLEDFGDQPMSEPDLLLQPGNYELYSSTFGTLDLGLTPAESFRAEIEYSVTATAVPSPAALPVGLAVLGSLAARRHREAAAA